MSSAAPAAKQRRSRQQSVIAEPDTDALLDSIQRRVLWLAVRMIHEANHIRAHPDGLKVGGHQASSASVVSILTALYFRWLRPQDLVSVKPHASPAYHAIQYLLHDLDRSFLTTLRAFGGLQSYPSRTKDPDRVDFSTGSVGLGAVTPMFASLADRYLRTHFAAELASTPSRRFVALVGDAELDEGNVWEAVLEDSLTSLGNVTVIVDLNRQSLDRVVPGIRIRRLEAMFAAAGWHVDEVKYGRRLQQAFVRLGGSALRDRIDAMSNEEYHALVRAPAGVARERLIDGVAPPSRDELARSLRAVDDRGLIDLISDLGGHDIHEVVSALDRADAKKTQPSVLFAYTMKGWGLPFAGDPMNHSALMTPEQIDTLASSIGVDAEDPWAYFDLDSPQARLCAERGEYLRSSIEQADARRHPIPDGLDLRIAPSSSTQQAFGDALATIARLPLGSRVVTASPDVSVSTSLGGWINRVGVFAAEQAPAFDDVPRALSWKPGPTGRHLELGISEMNLFLLLSQFGLTTELFGQTLVPVGTLYDPFIARGLDALVHALYVGSRFILVATPSGVTLAPEGGAHQSTITPSIGIELPGLRAYEPAFAQEAVWLLLEAARGCVERDAGFSTYLRLSTRLVDQSASEPIRNRIGEPAWRRQAIAGGYRLLESHELAPHLDPDAPTVNVVAVGAVVTEAATAVRFLVDQGVAANLIVVTSPDRLAAELHDHRMAAIRVGTDPDPPHLASLIPQRERRAPLVTVIDGASHSLSFIGTAFGAPVVPLGVDSFGQSGSIPDLYAYAGINADHIVEAAVVALDLQ